MRVYDIIELFSPTTIFRQKNIFPFKSIKIVLVYLVKPIGDFETNDK